MQTQCTYNLFYIFDSFYHLYFSYFVTTSNLVIHKSHVTAVCYIQYLTRFSLVGNPNIFIYCSLYYGLRGIWSAVCLEINRFVVLSPVFNALTSFFFYVYMYLLYSSTVFVITTFAVYILQIQTDNFNRFMYIFMSFFLVYNFYANWFFNLFIMYMLVDILIPIRLVPVLTRIYLLLLPSVDTLFIQKITSYLNVKIFTQSNTAFEFEKAFLDEGKSKPKRKRKVVDPATVFHGVGKIFSSPIYDDIKMPKWLYNITYEQIPAVLGSLTTYEPPLPKNVSESREQKERIRDLNLVRLKWQTYTGDVLLKKFLVHTYTENETLREIVTVNTKANLHYHYDPRINIKDFDPKLFISENRKPAVFTKDGDGIFFKLTDYAHSRSAFMTLKKIHSMLKSMVYSLTDKYTKQEVLDIFDKKCYVWQFNAFDQKECGAAKRKGKSKLETFDANKQFQIEAQKLSWLVPYLNPNYFQYDCKDIPTFMRIFHPMVCDLRSKIFAFVDDYYDMSVYTKEERQNLIRIRNKLFSQYMRSPAIQQLFLEGWTKEQVTTKIFNEHFVDIQKSAYAATGTALAEIQNRVDRSISVLHHRDKYAAMVSSFEQESEQLPPAHVYIPEVRNTTKVRKQVVVDDDGWVTVQSKSHLHSAGWFTFIVAFSLGLTFYLSKLMDYFQLMWILGGYGHRANNVFTKFNNCITDPVHYPLPDDYKLCLVEIKAILHTLYYINKRDRDSALAHASYFACTRPEDIIKFVNYIFSSGLVDTIKYPFVVSYNYMGRKRNVKTTSFHDHVHAYERDAYSHLIPDETDEIDVESFGDYISMVPDYLTNHLPIHTLKDMNVQFAFINNVTKFTSSKIAILKNLVSLVGRMVFAIDPFDWDYQEYCLSIIHILKEVEIAIMYTPKNKNDRETAFKTIKIYKDAQIIYHNPRSNTIPKILWQHFETRFKQLETIAKECQNTMIGARGRYTPMLIFLTGFPGGGKSALTNLIQNDIVYLDHQEDPTLPEEFTDNMSYSFSGVEKFFSGYANNKFVVLDDAFKTDDKEHRTTLAAFLIDAINTSIYQLDMAAVEDKGVCFFDSEYVIMSSNIANRGIKHVNWDVGLTDPRALDRRIRIVLHKDTKISEPFINDRFRIDRCVDDPSLENTYMLASEIPTMIRNMRKKQLVKESTFKYTTDFLREMHSHKIEDNNNDPVRLQAGKDDNRNNVDSSQEIISSLLELQLYEWWNSPYVKYYIIIAVIITLLGSSIPIYKFMFANKEQSFYDDMSLMVQSHEKKFRSGAPKRNLKYHKIIKAMNTRTESKNVVVQSSEQNFYKNMIKMSSAMVYIGAASYVGSFEGEKDAQESATGFHIKNGYFCVPAHFYLKFVDKPFVRFGMKTSTHSYLFEKPDVAIRIEDEDMVIFKIPIKINLPPEIYKYLIPEEKMYPIPTGNPLKMLMVTESGAPDIRNATMANLTSMEVYTCVGEQLIVECPITYWARTEAGNSGSLVVIQDNQGQALVIGMHVAVCRDYCIAIPICTSYFDQVMDIITTQSKGFPHDVAYKVPIEEANNAPAHSKFKRSPLYGIFGEPTYIPAKLRPFLKDGVEINPAYKAHAKFHQIATPSFELPESLIDYLFYYYPKKASSRIFTIDEAISGIEGEIPSINHTTSPGYPYNLVQYRASYGSTNTKGKEPYIHNIDGVYSCNPRFREHLEMRLAQLLRGEQISCIYADQLKDELRALEKVEEGKTRLFGIGPLDNTIFVRMYFLDFITYMQGMCVDKPISIGINVHSTDWTRLYQRLNSCTGSVIAGDFSNWDGVSPAFVAKFVCRFINEWYDDGPINARVRELLFEHIYNPYRIFQDMVYRIIDGTPSGSGLTGPGNSIENLTMTLYILIYVYKLRLDQFQLAFYGDDNLITISEPGFTVEGFAEHYKRYFGMTYTHFSKKEHIGTDTLADIRYLGRKFVKSDTVYLAPLDLPVTLESVYWTKGGITQEQVLLSTVDSLFTDLFHHGKQAYESISMRFLAAVQERTPELYTAIQRRNLPYFELWSRNYIRESTKNGFYLIEPLEST